MFNSDTDKEWERFGRDDPYYGVLTFDRYRRDYLAEGDLETFFTSGQEHLDAVITTVESHVLWNFTPVRALDFGCGVGRVLIPLAGISTYVTGVDVSPSMLAEARRNCGAMGVNNVELVVSDDTLSRLQGDYDFVHSFIVLQHIPVARGMRILGRLVELLAEGGVGVIQVTCGPGSLRRSAVAFVKDYIPLGKQLINIARGRPSRAPQMQMNRYDLNGIIACLRRGGVHTVYAEFTDHAGETGVILYFHKESGGAP